LWFGGNKLLFFFLFIAAVCFLDFKPEFRKYIKSWGMLGHYTLIRKELHILCRDHHLILCMAFQMVERKEVNAACFVHIHACAVIAMAIMFSAGFP
jgi:hypothetical protein